MLSLLGLQAQAFPVVVTYHGTAAEVGSDNGNYFGYGVDDPVTGSFYFDTDDFGLDEFINSSHAPAGEGIDLIHEAFGPDEIDGSEDELYILNIGGFVEEDYETFYAVVLAEFLAAAFDTSVLEEELIPGSEIWINIVEGYVELYALIFEETEEESVEHESYVGIELSSLHIEAPAAVPEPGTLGLIGSGLIGLAFARRRRAS